MAVDGGETVSLDVDEALLMSIKAAGGSIKCRTTIQKLLYFEKIFDIVDAEYKPHFYGPYSWQVSNSIQSLTSLNFIEERMDSFVQLDGARKRIDRYSYILSDDGRDLTDGLIKENMALYKRIEKLVQICKATTGLDQNVMSWAAKVYYILTTKEPGKPKDVDEIISYAESFGWTLSSSQLGEAVDLLRGLSLVK